jgi:hypothetical protein
MLGDMLRKPLNQQHKMEENYDLILPIKNILCHLLSIRKGNKKITYMTTLSATIISGLLGLGCFGICELKPVCRTVKWIRFTKFQSTRS